MLFTVNEHIEKAIGMRQKKGGPYLTTVRVLDADVPVYIGEYGWCRPLVSFGTDGSICWVGDDSYAHCVRFPDGTEQFAPFLEAVALASAKNR
jgi:hypothetical protein